jgi:hypothetical protein
MADAGQKMFWELGCRLVYDDSGRGMPRPQAEISFGWHRDGQYFEVCRRQLGIQLQLNRLKVSVELAEKFLLLCREKPYCERFLIDSSPCAQDVIEHASGRLHLTRGTAAFLAGAEHYPSLSVTLEGAGERVLLSHELRKSFGRRIQKLTPDDLRTNLRASVAA